MVYYRFLGDTADWKLIDRTLPNWGEDKTDQLYWLRVMRFWRPNGSSLWFKYIPEDK